MRGDQNKKSRGTAVDDRFRRLVEAVTDYAIYMLDTNGIVSSWNAGAERLKGYTETEIVGEHFGRFFTPEDRRNGKPERALETARREGRYEEEGWRVRRDGKRFWVLAVLDAIRDADGTVVGFAKITRDMTERRDAMEALRQSEQHFRLLVEGVVDYALFMLDAEGNVRNWNPGAERTKGYAPEEIIGRHFSVFYTPEDRAAGVPEEALRIATETGKYEAEAWRVRKGGVPFWASVVIDRILDDDGKLLGFAKVTRDISEKRALEQAREQLHQAQKMETVGQLTGGVAHDFNNLLTAVIGSLSLIGQITTDARVKRLVDTAQRAANRGAALTAQLLAFSRRQNLRPQTSDLNELIAVFEALLRRAAGETIAFDTDLAAGLWQVEVDQAQFQSALLNLVINARDAMPKGGTLRIETRNVEVDAARAHALKEIGPASYAVVAVIDSGEGMPPEVRARAIEPFYTTKEIGKGSGLGLSQVYGFARQSNGQVEIESEPGTGTAVRLYLPRSPNCTVGTGVPDAADAGAARRPTVLAVEDDPEVLDVTVETLRSLGYRVLSAGDARDALIVLERDVTIDVLFTDIVMPKGMNGVELARAARRLRPDLRVILASGYPREALRIREEIGEDMVYLGKPYQLGELADTLRGLTAAE